MVKSSPLSTDPRGLRVVQGGAAAQSSRTEIHKKEGPAIFIVTTALSEMVSATFFCAKIKSRTVIVPIVRENESRTTKFAGSLISHQKMRNSRK